MSKTAKKKARKKTVRKKKAKASRRRLTARGKVELIGRIEMALAGGMADTDAIRHFAEEQGASERQARRWVNEAHESQIQRIQRRRPELVARQAARLDLAIKLALEKVMHVVWEEPLILPDDEGTDKPLFDKNGRPINVKRSRLLPAPDVKTIVSAVSAANKLLGLDAPSRHEVMLGNVGKLLQVVVGLVKAHIPDPATRARFAADLRTAVEAQIEAQGGRNSLPDIDLPETPPDGVVRLLGEG